MNASKRIAFSLVAVASSVLLFCLSAELILRILGYEPFNLRKWRMISVEPGGKKFRKHPSLGYAHIPGKFEITVGGGHSYTVTHREDGLRITHPRAHDRRYVARHKVWVMGCSFTHGNALNDDETYPWLLQDRYPRYEFVNFGVEGYGTLHSLIQLEESLRTMPKPEIVVIGYTSLHDERNTFTSGLRKRRYQYNLLGPLVQPYARLDRNGELRFIEADAAEYAEWPLSRHSAFVNFAQDRYNAFQDRSVDSHAVTKALIKNMRDICARNEIELVVANLYVPDDMASFCSENAIPFVDAHVDLALRENNNQPYDGHPSAFANWQFAHKIAEFFDEHDLLASEQKDGGGSNAAAWYVRLGLAYYRSGYYRPALEASLRAAELDPSLAVAYNNACSAYSVIGRWDQAIRSCRKAVELDPDLELARDNLAWAERRRPSAAE